MTAELYTEVSQATIDHLKEQGFKTLQFLLVDQGNPYQATVEIIPGKEEGFALDVISLHSKEVEDFLDWESPMARYVIEKWRVES